MTAKRFMVDDAGTLIDIETREMYDIVEEVCPVLNALYEENKHLKTEIDTYKSGNKTIHERLKQLHKENQQLKEEIKDFQNLLQAKEETYLKPIYVALDEAITNERTHIGRNVLKQFKQTIME